MMRSVSSSAATTNRNDKPRRTGKIQLNFLFIISNLSTETFLKVIVFWIFHAKSAEIAVLVNIMAYSVVMVSSYSFHSNQSNGN